MVLSGHLSSEWLTHKVQFDWMARASSTTAAAIATRERGGHRHAYINQIIRNLFGSFSNTTECRRCLYSYFYMRISSPITSLRLAATPQFPTQVDSPPKKNIPSFPSHAAVEVTAPSHRPSTWLKLWVSLGLIHERHVPAWPQTLRKSSKQVTGPQHYSLWRNSSPLLCKEQLHLCDGSGSPHIYHLLHIWIKVRV